MIEYVPIFFSFKQADGQSMCCVVYILRDGAELVFGFCVVAAAVVVVAVVVDDDDAVVVAAAVAAVVVVVVVVVHSILMCRIHGEREGVELLWARRLRSERSVGKRPYCYADRMFEVDGFIYLFDE
jgi:hypothetical protein